MKERETRLTAIRRILRTRTVESQESMAEILAAEGWEVTQATLSRDLKELGVAKLPDGKGGYAYAFPESGETAGSEKHLVQDFLRGFLSIGFSGQFGVIRTIPGHASSVASALDHLEVAGILATIAGDDTILVIPRDGTTRNGMVKALEERIPGLKDRKERET